MSKRKYCYEFTEHRQYKCCECDRTMHKFREDFAEYDKLSIFVAENIAG